MDQAADYVKSKVYSLKNQIAYLIHLSFSLMWNVDLNWQNIKGSIRI